MDVSETTVRQVLKELHRSGVVRREQDGRQQQFALDREFLERRIEVAELDA
jgi:predicted transcriptional regulator